MKVTILGTGTSQGIPVIGCECEVCHSDDSRDQRLRCSVLVEVDEVRLLIDTSPDLRQQMLSNKVDRIDAILYTHEHNDHTAGLDDIRPYNFKQGGEMPAYGLPRVLDNLRSRFDYAFTGGAYPGAPRLKTYEMKDHSEAIFGVEVIPIPIMHGSLPILGYRIHDFAYLTDVSKIQLHGFDKLGDLKLLVIDALRHKKHHSHLTLDEALDIIERLKPDHALLTHISHDMGKCADWERHLPDNVQSAYDGQQIIL